MPPGEANIGGSRRGDGTSHGRQTASSRAHGSSSSAPARSAAATSPSSRAGIASSSIPSRTRTITLQNGKATPSGIDAVLLQQRADFLRPDSLLAIIMLTDENDCSIKEYGQFYYAGQQQNPQDSKKKFHLPRARRSARPTPTTRAACPAASAAEACPADPTLHREPDAHRRRGRHQPPLLRPEAPLRHRLPLPDRSLHPGAHPADGARIATARWSRNPIFTDLDPSDDDSQPSAIRAWCSSPASSASPGRTSPAIRPTHQGLQVTPKSSTVQDASGRRRAGTSSSAIRPTTCLRRTRT